MIKDLLDYIMSPNAELKIEVNICRSSHSSIFFKASTYLSTVVARLYPSANVKSSPQAHTIHVKRQSGLISQKSPITQLVTNPGHKCRLATVFSSLL